MRDLKSPTTSEKPAIVSLFSGAGGLDLGFTQEGYQIALAVDSSPSAIDTHNYNFRLSKSVVADLSEIGPGGVVDHLLGVLDRGSNVGIIGGPPCQGFSRANVSSKPDDSRNLLPTLYVEIIEEIQKYYSVEFVVFENVLGMKDKKHTDKYHNLIQGLKNLGFNLYEKQLCAYDYGVPQNRHRIIVAALKSNRGYSHILVEGRVGKMTVREAIGSLTEPAFFDRSLQTADIPLHPNHWTMKPKSDKFNQVLSENNKTRSFRKLNWEKASPTIAFGNREIHVHPNGKRRISIYEAMLLQGFPSSFVLKGTLSQQVQQVSNAVPPPLARSIAAALTKSMGDRTND